MLSSFSNQSLHKANSQVFIAYALAGKISKHGQSLDFAVCLFINETMNANVILKLSLNLGPRHQSYGTHFGTDAVLQTPSIMHMLLIPTDGTYKPINLTPNLTFKCNLNPKTLTLILTPNAYFNPKHCTLTQT